MIIDDRFQFVFQHLPKTGGTFISHVLRNNIASCGILLNHGLKWYIDPEHLEFYNSFEQNHRHGHINHTEFRRLNKDIIENYTLWIGVRHPIEIWISHYIDFHHHHLIEKTEPNPRHTPISFAEHIINHTQDFDALTSISRKLENAIKLADQHAGSFVIRQENLETDLLTALHNVDGLEVHPLLYDDIMYRRLYDRSVDPTARQMIRYEILKNHQLCKKILDFEYFLVDEFYNHKLKT